MREPLAKPAPPPTSLASSLAAAVRFLWPSQVSQDFHWFSTLGWPSVKSRPFVRVLAKEEQTRKSQLGAQKYQRGFLLRDVGNSSAILLTDLRAIQLPRNDDARVMESADLLQDAAAYLEFLRHPANRDDRQGPARFGQHVPAAVEVFVLAWACEQNGHWAMARQLYELAQAMSTGRARDTKAQRSGPAARKSTLRQRLEHDLSTAWMRQTILYFQFPTVSLRDLLKRCEALVKNFPNSPHVADAQAYAVTLKRMIREDEEHPASVKPSEQLSPPERLKELIFQLRTQNGPPSDQPGGCDIFADPRGEASPAHQLLNLGLGAVPELVTAFEDKALTRSVAYQRDSAYAHRVVTVAEYAMTIVQIMFGRSFRHPGNRGNDPREIATAWLNEARQKGMTRMLVEGVEQGKEGSARQAEVLLAQDPAALSLALPIGFDRAMEPWVRRDLVEIAARIPGEEIVPFLQKRLQSYNLHWAVMAAWGLHQRGNPDAVAVMVERWKAKLADGLDGEDGVDHLIQFLVASASEPAFAALAADFHQRSTTLRLKVVETLADGALPFWLERKYPGLWSGQMKQKISPAALEILEQLLVSCLNDTAGGNWTTLGPNGQIVQNPRVCDYAGKLLAQEWKQKYTFDFWAGQAERDRQRLQAIRR